MSRENPKKASVTVRYARLDPVPESAAGYGLSVEVVNSVNMPRKIFAVRRFPSSATDPELQTTDVLDEFNHVATTVDLSAIPEDAPEPDKSGVWYRTDHWDFSFRNPADMEESMDLMRKDIQLLVNSINASERVETYLEETYE